MIEKGPNSLDVENMKTNAETKEEKKLEELDNLFEQYKKGDEEARNRALFRIALSNVERGRVDRFLLDAIEDPKADTEERFDAVFLLKNRIEKLEDELQKILQKEKSS